MSHLRIAIMLFALSPLTAVSGIMVNFAENSGQIDVTISGSADVSAFTGSGLSFGVNSYSQSPTFMLIGTGLVTRWQSADVAGGFSGSQNTGSLLNFTAFPSGLPPVGIIPNELSTSPFSGIYLPTGYAGESLSGAGSFAGTFADLGATAGDVYSVTWQSNGSQSIQFVMAGSDEPSPMPSPATSLLLLLGLMGIVKSRRRQ